LGKPSSLRTNDKPKESRQQYSNGDRKFYDKDACPEGADFDTWSLTLLFEQLAEANKTSLPGRIIVYTHLRSRIERSNFMVEDNGQWVEILEQMIRKFWDDYIGGHPLDDFCDIEYFDWVHQWVIDTRERKELLRTHVRVTRDTVVKKPAKQSNEDLKIIYKTYSDEELKVKMSKFKQRLQDGEFD
jgi:hypothetical protein